MLDPGTVKFRQLTSHAAVDFFFCAIAVTFNVQFFMAQLLNFLIVIYQDISEKS